MNGIWEEDRGTGHIRIINKLSERMQTYIAMSIARIHKTTRPMRRSQRAHYTRQQVDNRRQFLTRIYLILTALKYRQFKYCIQTTTWLQYKSWRVTSIQVKENLYLLASVRVDQLSDTRSDVIATRALHNHRVLLLRRRHQHFSIGTVSSGGGAIRQRRDVPDSLLRAIERIGRRLNESEWKTLTAFAWSWGSSRIGRWLQ